MIFPDEKQHINFNADKNCCLVWWGGRFTVKAGMSWGTSQGWRWWLSRDRSISSLGQTWYVPTIHTLHSWLYTTTLYSWTYFELKIFNSFHIEKYWQEFNQDKSKLNKSSVSLVPPFLIGLLLESGKDRQWPSLIKVLFICIYWNLYSYIVHNMNVIKYKNYSYK